MQIGATTYTTNTSVVFSAYERTSRGVVRPEKYPEETDRYEPSGAVFGAAKTLPGQGEGSGYAVYGADGAKTVGIVNESASPAVASGGVGNNDASDVSAGQIDDASRLPSQGESEEANTAEEKEKRDPMTGEAELDHEEQKQVEQLEKRDQEVRTHEHAHVAAGGQYVRGGIQYEYETGPNGRRYAVGGEVSIDTSPVSGDPQATIQKAQTIRRAAMAPAEPSGQDRQAAAAAAQMEAKARQELLKEQTAGDEDTGEDGVVEDVLGASALGEEETTAGSEHASKEANGLLVEAPASKGKGLGNTKTDAGLPEVSASASQPPVVRLDYQRGSQQAGSLVDMYG